MVLTILAEDPEEMRMTQVGRITDHVEVKIVDSNGLVVPVGKAGELCTRGFHVMQKYWDDEEKTREAMRDNNWFHTG